MVRDYDWSRREAIRRAALAAGTVLVAGAAASGQQQDAAQDAAQEPDEAEIKVTPPEDLTREHAVLERLLLIYEKALSAGSKPDDWPLKQLTDAVRLVRTFVEDYHEKLEEDYIFPRFEKAGKLTDLTAILRRQHAAGRRETDTILRRIPQVASMADMQPLTNHLVAFIRMYRPHAARESSVLFPQLSSVVKPDEYDEMGDTFEEIEHQKFGPAGFEGVVQKVAEIEKSLSIYDLAQFTPKPT